MFKPGFILMTTAQFEAAIFNKTPVCVWQHGNIIEYGGPIEVATENAVSINGEKYLRAVCEFRIR
jgi:hypothetical protein